MNVKKYECNIIEIPDYLINVDEVFFFCKIHFLLVSLIQDVMPFTFTFF
jgi:hypothetical protein